MFIRRSRNNRTNLRLCGMAVDNGNYYETAAGAGIRGADTGWWLTWLGSITAAVNNNDLVSCTVGGSGYYFYTSASDNLWLLATNGVGANAVTPAYDPAAIIGKLAHLTGVHTGAGNQLKIYVNGAEHGTPGAGVGYTPAGGGVKMKIGGGSASSNVCLGLMGGLGVPNDAQIAANATACRVARRLVTMAGVTPDHMWMPHSPNVDVLDTIGSDTMARVGTPSVRRNIPWSY